MRRNPLRLLVILFATVAAAVAVGASGPGGHHATAGIMPPVGIPVV